MDDANFAHFVNTLGYCLPRELMSVVGHPPHLETDVERLIQLNRDVRIPGTPWIGEAGDPWPDDHVVIGEDQCGNYYSVLRVDGDRSGAAAVWFLDHELATLEVQHGSIEQFQQYLENTFPPEVFAVGDWTVRAQVSVGPIKFGMTPDEVRTALNVPFATFNKSADSADPTDAFDTLELHVYYRDGKCEAVEFFDPSNVRIGGHRLAEETFADMCLILNDYISPQKQTAASYQSSGYGVEFSISKLSDADVVGAIAMVIVTDTGYFERQDALLAVVLGGNPTSGPQSA